MGNNVKSQSQNLSNSNYVVGMLLISLLVLGVTALIGKSLVSSVRLNTKVVNLKNTANHQLDADITAAPTLVSSYNGLGATNKILTDALPTIPDFPGLIASLENMANKSGMSLKSVSPDMSAVTSGVTSSSTNAPKALQVDVSLEGSYTSLRTFLSELENSARPMRVSTAQFSGSGSDLTVTMTLSTYYQTQAQLPF